MTRDLDSNDERTAGKLEAHGAIPDGPEGDVEVDELETVGDLDTLAGRRERFAELTMRKRLLDAGKRVVQAELDALEEQVLDDYVELGTDSMRTTVGEDRFTVHLAPQVWARPRKTGEDDRGDPASTEQDWHAACTALKAAGLGQYVGERFNAQSLAGWLNEFRAEHGPGWRDELPEGFADALDIGDRQRVRVRKA